MKKISTEKTIEILSGFSANDLWEELDKEFRIPYSVLYLPNGVETRVRFLGPFAYVNRFYFPAFTKELSCSLKDIVDLNIDAITKAKSDLENQVKHNFNNPALFSQYQKAIAILKDIMSKKIIKWQRCILINVLVRSYAPANYSYSSSKIQIMALIPSLVHSVLNSMEINGNSALGTEPSNNKISGILAHDFVFKKPAFSDPMIPVKSNTIVYKGPFSPLSNEEIEYILKNGLYDIPSFITHVNKKFSSYYYRDCSDYKMPEKFMQSLIEESKNIHDNRHIEYAEEHLDEIPPDAFENKKNMNNSIGSLEIV